MRPRTPAQSAEFEPPITVAVVSWNTRDLLLDCIRSLEPDAQAGRLAVWVVDNGSSDGSAEGVREAAPWVRLLASEENIGYGAAINHVATRTQTPWLICANADIRVHPGALESLMAQASQHPKTAVVSPCLVHADGSIQMSIQPFPSLPFALAYACGVLPLAARAVRRWSLEQSRRTLPCEIDWAVGAFLLIRRTAFDEVGGFDESQWMYAEDLDLQWRLRQAGWRARFAPGARVTHVESASTSRAWGAERHHRWHASTYAWTLRRRGLARTRLTAATYVAGFLLRAALRAPSALLGRERARAAVRSALSGARSHAIGLRPRHELEKVR